MLKHYQISSDLTYICVWRFQAAVWIQAIPTQPPLRWVCWLRSTSHASGEKLLPAKAATSRMCTRPTLVALVPQHKKATQKPCAEPACNNKATVTHQLSNAVLEKEHTALPCYAAQGWATLLTLTYMRSLSPVLPGNSKFFSVYLKQIAPKISLPYRDSDLVPTF